MPPSRPGEAAEPVEAPSRARAQPRAAASAPKSSDAAQDSVAVPVVGVPVVGETALGAPSEEELEKWLRAIERKVVKHSQLSDHHHGQGCFNAKRTKSEREGASTHLLDRHGEN